MKGEIFDAIERAGIVPVIRAGSTDDALEASHALIRGGVKVLEVTLTVPGALDVMAKLREELDRDVLVGAGTVLTLEQARECLASGAEFLVTPGLNRDIIELCHERGIDVMPGALTPTEVINAWQLGASCVKVFPCSALGGAKYLRSLRGPLPDVKLMPTGGVNLNTADAYLAAGAVALGVGSELVDPVAVAAGKFDVIEENARQFVRVVSEARRLLGRNHAA